MEKYKDSNNERSEKVEKFLISEATAAGVLNETTKRMSINPNKWEKHLAPWFTARCREARARYRKAVKQNGKGHEHTQQALKRYVKSCKEGRAQL
jgi:hypothetical protein